MIKGVLCWDIDGTLLTTARAGVFAWEDAFHAVSHRKISLASFNTAGLTDVEIARTLAKELDDTRPDTVQEILTGYEDRLSECLSLRQGAVLPGVIAVLEALQSHPDIYSILLTGNTQKGAKAKLAHYGLDTYFNKGAFADGLPDRPSVARRAVSIIEQKLKKAIDVPVYVIGDTPHDIHCGKSIGAKTIAVCTGQYNQVELTQYNPWLILESLTDAEHFFQQLELGYSVQF